MVELIEQNREAIASLCRKYGIRKLEVFGSAATDRFDPGSSDVDFLYEIDDGPNLVDRYFGIIEELETLLGRRIDFVSSKDAKNPFFLEVANRSRVTLYAA